MLYPSAAAAAAAQNFARAFSSPTPEVGKKLSNEEIEARFERMNLIIQTLVMILLEKQVLQEEELRQWLVYVDELDGARDGKLREDRSPRECPKCKRKSPRAAARCLYCQHEFPPEVLIRTPG